MATLQTIQAALTKLEEDKKDLLSALTRFGWSERKRKNKPARRVDLLNRDVRFVKHYPGKKGFKPDFLRAYSRWYASGSALLEKNQPSRLAEYRSIYENPISLYFDRGEYSKTDQWEMEEAIERQFSILSGIVPYLEFSVLDIELTAYSVLMADELEAARHLVKKGYLRAAGAIAGVILERHLKNLLRKSVPPIKFKETATLSTLNGLCKDKVYDTLVWSKVEHLTRLRNLCDHDKEREPTLVEVEELLIGVDTFISNNPTPIR